MVLSLQSMISDVVSSIIASVIIFIISIYIENKYHVINRAKKKWTVLFNKETTSQMALEYKTKSDFEKIKEEFKNTFRSEKRFDIKKTTQLSMAFTYDIFSINIINTKTGTVFVEVERMGCGINDMKEKINYFLAKMNELSKKEVLSSFLSCDLTFSLPYKWEDLNLYIPKNFEIKEYTVSYIDEKYKSEIKISLNQVYVKTDAVEAISQIIDRFV